MMKEESSSSNSYFHLEGSGCGRKSLTVHVTSRMGAGFEYAGTTTPSPQSADQTSSSSSSCFCKLDLFRKCLVGGEVAQLNMVQTPTGELLSAISLPLSATPLHEEIIACDENSVPALYAASPVQQSATSFSPMNNVSSTSSSSNHALRRSPPSVSPLHRLHYRNSEQRWEELEDDLLIRLNGRLDHLTLLQKLHSEHDIQNSFLLRSIAYLSTFRKGQSESDESIYYEYISAVAAYLSVGRAKRERKLAVIQTLMTCLSPAEASWQVRDAIIEGTLDFIIIRSNEEWEFMEHTETMLIWELRAMSLRLLDREQERVALVAKTGDTAAIVISAGARLMEEGMTRSGTALSSKIEDAGVQVKGHLKANDYPLMMDRDAVVALAFSDAAKRASAGAKESTKLAMDGIRDASSRGIQMVASKFEEGNIGESLPPEGREALMAAGKVGLATIGAAAIVGETLLETSRLVMEKTGKVASDVVEHKYGTSAGKVASDANETAANILRTIGSVAHLSETGTFAKTIASDEAKQRTILEAEKAKEAIKRFESQMTSLLKNTMQIGGGWVGPRQLTSLSSKAALPIAKPTTAQTNPETSQAECDFTNETKSGSQAPDLAPSSSMDSESCSSTSFRRTFSSDEDNSYGISKSNQSASASTTAATIASRRSSSSRRSLQGPITPNSTAPRRKSHLRTSTPGSKRRGTGKRTPLTPDVS